MDIETLFNLASEELKGENALIQIQVGNKMYIKLIGVHMLHVLQHYQRLPSKS